MIVSEWRQHDCGDSILPSLKRLYNSHDYCNFTTQLFYYIYFITTLLMFFGQQGMREGSREKETNKTEVEGEKEILNREITSN